MLNVEHLQRPKAKTYADCSPEELEFLAMLHMRSELERKQMFRYAVRLLNSCPKAHRLTNMANSGQISRKQLLESM
jgi:hypothetical protein